MKATFLILVLSLCMISCRQGSFTSDSTVPANGQLPDTTDITNNFYDNTLTNALQQYDLIIEGEVANPGKVNFSTLLVRTEPEEDGGLFRVFPASVFFSDRAIKSLSEIHLIR